MKFSAKFSAKFSPVQRLFPALILAALLLAPACSVLAQHPAAGVAVASVEGNGGRLSTPEAQSAAKNEQEKDESDEYRHSAAVRALGAKLGMNAEQAATTFTVLNFIVLAILVGWFLIKTLPKTFRDRSSAIQKHLVDARTATEEASARLNSVETRLGTLDEQIAAMRAQAEKDAALDEQRIRAAVEEEKQKILRSAEQEIAAATVHARKQLQQYAADLAIEQAARKLVVTAETDRLLVQGFARRLTGEETKGGEN